MKDKNIFQEAHDALRKQRSLNMWGRVSMMKWGNPGYDYKAIASDIYSHWGDEVIIDVRKFCEQKVNSLIDRIRLFNKNQRQFEHEITFGGEYSMYDVLWHIVGLGEKEYTMAMNNPVRIRARYETGYKQPNGYVETFAYCFHKPKPEPVAIPVTGKTCWCCGASTVPPTQEEMLRDFGHHFSNISENELVNFAMMILKDLPEEILESYYVKNILKKVV
jgi:hypothetical protein